MNDTQPNPPTHPTQPPQAGLPPDDDSRHQQPAPTLDEIVTWVGRVGGRWASPEDIAQI